MKGNTLMMSNALIIKILKMGVNDRMNRIINCQGAGFIGLNFVFR